MAKLPILTFPHERLRIQATPVEQFDDTLKNTIKNMYETMYAADGIGLAATQVDYHKRLIVIDVSEDRNEPLTLINPTIAGQSGEAISQEGCLSVPEFFADVKRAQTVEIAYQTESGETKKLNADGLLAICIQHEIDHLNGKLFIDYLSPLKREKLLKQIQRQK